MTSLRAVTAVCLLSLFSPLQAELPKAISVSPIGIAPGTTTTVSVNGLYLSNATELWTNLEADIRSLSEVSVQQPELQGTLSDEASPPSGTLIREAEEFDRGDYGQQGIFILNGNFKPNYAEWNFDVEQSQTFLLEIRYASGQSRPMKLSLNGRLLTESALDGVTGGFGDGDVKWMPECVLSLRRGINTLRLELTGGTPHIDKLALVPTELPATRFATVKPSDRIAPFDISVPEGTPAGIRGLRVATREGISNLLLFMVDDLPTVPEIRGQSSSESGQLIELPVAVEGYCDSGRADRYRFRAEVGETVTIEAVATRIGSKLDPVISLTTAEGRELAFIDDSPGLDGDCVLRHPIESPGDYVIAIDDALMGGASGHRYRLRIGNAPQLTLPLPTGVSVLSRQSSSPPLTLASSQTWNVTELPIVLQGTLKQPDEHHVCGLTMKKGDRITVVDSSRGRGVPTILSMSIRDKSEKTLARISKAGPSGQKLNWQAPSDGQFELVLADIIGRSGQEFAYRVQVSRTTPDFSLSVEKDSAILPQNGYTLLKVTAVRNGYNGPIKLSVKGLGDTPRLLNDVIPEKQKDIRLKVYLPTDLLPGQTRQIRITGSATIDGETIERTASTLAAFRKAFPQTPVLPGNLDGLVAATVGSEIPDFFALSVDNNAVLFPRLVGEVYFTVRARDRAKGFKDPVNIRIEGLPEGFSAGGGERPVSRSENNEYRFQLRGPTSIESAELPLRIIAEGSFKGQTKEVELAKVPLKIIEPLLISAASEGPFTAGAGQKLTLKATRFVPRAGGDKGPVEVTFSEIPEGVSVPLKATIPAGKSEAKVEITIDANAELAKLAPLRVTAKTTVAGQSVEAATTLSFQSANSRRQVSQ